LQAIDLLATLMAKQQELLRMRQAISELRQLHDGEPEPAPAAAAAAEEEEEVEEGAEDEAALLQELLQKRAELQRMQAAIQQLESLGSDAFSGLGGAYEDEKDEEKQEKERERKEKARAEKKKEEKERLRKGKAAAEMCGSFDAHYHAPAAAVARRAQQRQPQIAKKENSFLPSLEPQDSLPKKLSESSPFRRAGYSGSIPLEANLEIPATKANLESPPTHQSQTNSIAK
jgi:hypothetical protein